jgi:hypothetical protein
MRTIARWGLLSALALGAATAADAETVFLKNGEEVTGQIIERSPIAIVVKEERTGRLRTIRRSEIDLILAQPAEKPPPPLEPEPDAKGGLAPAKAATTEPGEAAPAGGTPKAGETAAKQEPGAGEAKAGETAAKQEPGAGEAKAGETAAKQEPGAGEAKAGETAAKQEPGAGEAEAGETAAKQEPGAGEPKAAEKPTLPPDVQKVVDEAMLQLDSDDPPVRAQAKQDLLAQGVQIIPALTEGLYHRKSEARAVCADILGDMSARNAIKQLIEAFYAAMPDRGECATYQRVFVRALGAALAKVTGQHFLDVEARSPLVQEKLAKYVLWYNDNYDRLPAQVGEPRIAPTDQEYPRKLKEARALKLEKREWPRPPLSADIIQGQDKVEAPAGAAGARKTDVEFGKSFTRTDRESGGGLIREGDKKFRDGFFRGEEQK